MTVGRNSDGSDWVFHQWQQYVRDEEVEDSQRVILLLAPEPTVWTNTRPRTLFVTGYTDSLGGWSPETGVQYGDDFMKHLCIACGLEHLDCCGSCKSHCYRCMNPRDENHGDEKCHQTYIAKHSPQKA